MPAGLRARDLAGDPAGFGERWSLALAASPAACRADALYTGRGFAAVRRAAAAAGADLAVLSAGLGVVMGATPVPSYSLTLATGPDALRACAPDVRPADWWRAASASPFACDLPGELAGRPVAVLALTRGYAAMIAETLEALDGRMDRVRLIGLGLERVVPACAARSVLPYDRRIEPLLAGGTAGEFAARATAFHLASRSGRGWDLDEEREEAERLSRAGTAPAVPGRRRVTDDDILAAVDAAGGRASAAAALRGLRRSGVACGFERMARLLSGAGTTGPVPA